MTMRSDELGDLRTTVRTFLDRESPEPVVRATMETRRGYDPELWSAMATRLGLQGVAVPEEFGGAGAGSAEQAVVFEELGRSLACAPYLATVGLAAPLMLAAADPDRTGDWLAALAAGGLIATAALTGRTRQGPGDVPVTATRAGDGWELRGEETHVLDPGVADLLLVLARHGEQISLFAVEGDGPVVDTPRTSDRTRRLGSVRLDGVPATMVGSPGAGLEIAARALPHAVAALSAEQVGGAARVLEMSVEYAKSRIQFGRPIGSFQAVKHRCADMLVALETARSASWALARGLDSGDPEVPLLAAIARVVCSQTYLRCASDAVQVHGGIGYTWEHPVQLHVKRSRSGAVLFGTVAEQRRVVADLVPALAVNP
jgi:acyl-CoA dehydrogenase